MADPFRHGHDMTKPARGWPRGRNLDAPHGIALSAAHWSMAGHAWDLLVVARHDPTLLAADLSVAGADMAQGLRAALVNDMESLRHALGLRADAFAQEAGRWATTRDTLPGAAALVEGMARLASTNASEAVATLYREPSSVGHAVAAAELCAEGEEAWRVLERLKASGMGIDAGLATDLRRKSATALNYLESIWTGLGTLYGTSARAIPSRGEGVATARARAEEDLSDTGGGYRTLEGIDAIVAGLRAGYAGDVVAESLSDGRHPLSDDDATALAARAGEVLRTYHETFNVPGFGASLRRAAALSGFLSREAAPGGRTTALELTDELERFLAAADCAPAALSAAGR